LTTGHKPSFPVFFLPQLESLKIVTAVITISAKSQRNSEDEETSHLLNSLVTRDDHPNIAHLCV